MEFKKSLLTSFLLLLIIGLNGVTLVQFSSKDLRPNAWDESIHTRVAFDYQERIADEGFLSVLKPAYFNYPPLYHLTLIPFLGIPADVADAGPLVNFFYLIFLVLGVFLLGDQILGRIPGLTAAFLVTCYPVIIYLMHLTMIDVALTAWVTWAMLCLVKSENFSQRSWSLAFGLVLGLAMLTKWTALAYVLAPMAVAGFNAIRQKNKKWFFASVVIFAVVAGPWYLTNLIPALARISHGAGMQPASGIILDKWLNWMWYPLALFKQINLFFVLLFIPGLFAVYWKPKLWPLVLWFLGSLVIFSIFTNRNIRYTMPALPAVALLSVAWVPLFRKGTFLIVNLGIAAFFIFFHWVPGEAKTFFVGPVEMPVVGRVHPETGSWKHHEIIDEIQQRKNPSKAFTRIIMVSNAPYFHSTSINITSRVRGITDFSFRGPSKRRFFEFADFILLKTGNLGPGFTAGTVGEVASTIENPPQWFNSVFKIVKKWDLPDGSQAVLFQADPDPMNIADVGLFNLELDELKLPRIVASGVKLIATPDSKESLKLGRLAGLKIHCKKVIYKEFEFLNVNINLTRPQINLPLFLESGEIQLLSLDRLGVQAESPSTPLIQYLERKAKWLKDLQLVLDGPKIKLKSNAYGIPLDVQADIRVENRLLKTKLEQVKILKIPFPLFILRSLTDQRVSLNPNRETPFFIDINQIEGHKDNLKIL